MEEKMNGQEEQLVKSVCMDLASIKEGCELLLKLNPSNQNAALILLTIDTLVVVLQSDVQEETQNFIAGILKGMPEKTKKTIPPELLNKFI